MKRSYETLEFLVGFVKSVEEGGAAALRIEGKENLRAVRHETKLPIIAFIMGEYDNGAQLITPSLDDIEDLFSAGADIVACDVTGRKRPNGLDGFSFLEEARSRFDKPLWADVAAFREGVKAASIGADFVATTLSGYTPATIQKDQSRPDFQLIRDLAFSLTIPVIAEGRIYSQEDAAYAIAEGAYAVVVGTAITRPRILARMFSNTISHVAQNLHAS